MWKVGDKIKFVKYGIRDSLPGFCLTLGKEYKILSIQIGRMEKCYLDKRERGYRIKKDDGQLWWIEPDSFRLVNKELPKSEIEFLDRLKENEENYYK